MSPIQSCRKPLGGGRAAQTSGQMRPVEPPGEVGLSACPMESGAAWKPPIHPIHVHGHPYHLSTV
ncbi:hypothetical protein RRU94_24510 [Domibacillus sp. DTU_2020_1001157_1_SI_ALB_TIR_016]|uniref:hypothetical protein n=1 Tax=Domibacillus sp. DTU_2020_1001157_1_SI_ALB_TIR_016 TaxID=3077789 RepID=UPI0028E2269A|nr:hypothetical protein [Domibacillus sp. DTU_2020_1001157_1_SI_ALB_TIR_016]WNS80590.1 hypothetical protein RRU94_24510 [Domibacillus sp. DTU_2020_1001157_1_SI_ALB_TIR_016]